MGYKYFETVTSFPAQPFLKLTEITLRKSSISFFPLSFFLTYWGSFQEAASETFCDI